jgi:8-amino-7-oxononanoate synthase
MRKSVVIDKDHKKREVFDPFNEYFKENNFNYKPDRKSLLDISNARRWFRNINEATQNNVYTYQQAMEEKSGPIVKISGKDMYMLSSYDYMGLIGNVDIENASIDAVKKFGTGTGGVRMLTGTTILHRELESAIAKFKGTDDALTFTSGYMANLSVISALMGKSDRILADAKIHRSLSDALDLAGVSYKRFIHNSSEDLERMLQMPTDSTRTFIIVEGVYSMDGDLCPLPEILALKNKYNAFLVVDEAHSFGMLGPNGRGIDDYYGIDPTEIDIITGSLGKTIPSSGGFITGKRDLMIYLQHGAAPFMFSAALCPPAVASAIEGLNVIENEPERLNVLRRNTRYLRTELRDMGYNTGDSQTPIIPIILGENDFALSISKQLYELNILAIPVVFPAVAKGQARLRLCATASQTIEMLDEIIIAFEKVAIENGISKKDYGIEDLLKANPNS